MSELEKHIQRAPTRRPINRFTLFGVPLDLLAMLAVPVTGVLVALLLPLIRVLRELLP